MAGRRRRSPLPSPTATSCRARLRQEICKDFCSGLCSNLDFGGKHRTHQLTSSYAAPAEVRWRPWCPLEACWAMRQALHQAPSAPSAPRIAITKRLRPAPSLPAERGDMQSVTVICRRVAFQITLGNLRQLRVAACATLPRELAGCAPLPS